MQKFRIAAEHIHDVAVRELLEIKAPPIISDREVERIHTSGYLNGLKTASLGPQRQKRIGLPLKKQELYERSKLEVSGTVAAARSALETGIAFNLAGGTHHAYPDHGSGYCVLNDVAIAIETLRETHLETDLQIMVIDTDAHQGNGTHAIFQDDPYVFTYDIHVGKNFPSQKESGSLDVPLERWVNGEIYLNALEKTLPMAVEEFEPDLIFWITGADPHLCDRFGQMDLNSQEIDARNELVMRWILQSSAPVTVLFGGGYHFHPDETGTLHARAVMLASAEFYRHRGHNSQAIELRDALSNKCMQVTEEEVPRIGKAVPHY